MGKNKKIVIIISVVFVIAIAVAAVILLHNKKDDSYRILKVYEVEGDAKVVREGKGDIEPYANMVLESGDRVILNSGTFTIKADDDKYIYLEDNTELVLTAEGDSDNSKTTIELVSGAITNDIQNKLSAESSYEVNTPNSTMSVRGTIYRVWIYEEDGVVYTKVSVFQGSVATKLVYSDGTLSAEEVLVENGKEVIIYDDGDTTDYMSEPKEIDLNDLPEKVLRILKKFLEKNRDITIDEKKVDKALEGPFDVIFMYNGTEFGRQTVKKGECATMPSLAPAETGGWDFEFSTPIDRDVTIEWK